SARCCACWCGMRRHDPREPGRRDPIHDARVDCGWRPTGAAEEVACATPGASAKSAIMKHAAVLLLAFAVSFAGCGGCQRAEDIGTSKEIMSGSMEKTGDTWHVTFKTKIDAPPDRVFEAFAQPERSREFAPDTVMKSELVSQNGNVKVVDLVGKLDILPPGFKVQDLRNELTLHPETKTITSKTVDFK